ESIGAFDERVRALLQQRTTYTAVWRLLCFHPIDRGRSSTYRFAVPRTHRCLSRKQGGLSDVIHTTVFPNWISREEQQIDRNFRGNDRRHHSRSWQSDSDRIVGNKHR